MNIIRIAAGTTSKKKIQYLAAVLKKLKIEAVIEAVKTESGVSDQPLTTTETKTGSVNRANSALAQNPEADLGIGIEMGGDFDADNRRETFCWVTVTDRRGRCFSAQSFSLRQPKYYADILKAGKILGQHRHDFRKLYGGRSPIHEYLGKILEYRKPFIDNALEKALIYYFCEDEF